MTKIINNRNPKDKQKIKEKFELLQCNTYLIIYMENADNRGDIY
jgi:hypothetical protein